jgi:hypothetical protein
MTQRERELLTRIARPDRFGRKNVHDVTDGETFDREVEELQQLEAQGWIDLKLMPNHQTRHGRWYAAVATLTANGRAALLSED